MRNLEYRLEREFDRRFKTTYGNFAENQSAREREIYMLGKEHGRQLEQEKSNDRHINEKQKD